MRQTSGSIQRALSPKRQAPKIASNMIELSNIQYLFKYVNYVSIDPHTMFQKCLQSTHKNQSQTYFTSSQVKKLPQVVPFEKFNQDEVKIKQQKSAELVKFLVNKSVSSKPPTPSLSKQQLLHMASSKIMEGKAKEQQQIAKSRRSFDYIQSLKSKITSAIDSSKQIPTQQSTIQLNQIIKHLQFLEETRTTIKLQLYYIQKEQIQFSAKFQAYKSLETNLFQAKQFYTLYLSQVEMNSYTKSKILNETQKSPSKYLSYLPDNRTQSIMRLEKFLNSILIDEREMNIIKHQLGIN